MDLSSLATNTSISILVSRVLGKVIGITLVTYLLLRLTKFALPETLNLRDIVGIGLLCGMGMTVSLVIAEITVKSELALSGVRSGLFLAAITSGLLGVFWLKVVPAER
jgi:NhaA family Na+:H+ antiporter